MRQSPTIITSGAAGRRTHGRERRSLAPAPRYAAREVGHPPRQRQPVSGACHPLPAHAAERRRSPALADSGLVSDRCRSFQSEAFLWRRSFKVSFFFPSSLIDFGFCLFCFLSLSLLCVWFTL